MPDFTFKQGDAGPVITDTLKFSDGTLAPLQGATIIPIMRSLTASKPATITGPVTVTNYQTAAILYTPTTADTSQQPGAYMLNWQVTYPSGQLQTFPTQGYLWGVIEPNLASEPQALVSLPDVKEYLHIKSDERSRDNKLLGWINDVTPLIENIAGPILVRTVEEWHDGGQYWVRLRRKPSFALGTSPILNIVGCDEYRGPIKYALSVIADPTQASIYSCMLDQRTGTLYRRTTGGGVIPFGAGPWGGGMPQAVHVIYQTGQQTVPGNVRRAALEAIRWNYMATQPTGTGSRSLGDTEDLETGPTPFAFPRSAMEWLTPNRRHPAIA